MRPWHALNKAKKKERKEKDKKLRDVSKSHIYPDYSRLTTPTKVVMFGSLRGRNLPFSYAWHYGLYNRLGLPPSL